MKLVKLERERDKRHTLITKYLFLFILQFYKQSSTVQDDDVLGVCKSTQVGMYIYTGEPSTMRQAGEGESSILRLQ